MEKQLNKEMIRRLADGEIMLTNEKGTLEELREILKAAAPKDEGIPSCWHKYYKVSGSIWYACSIDRNMEMLPISSFYEEVVEQKQFPRWMWVGDTDNIEKAIKLFVINYWEQAYWTLDECYEPSENRTITKWKFAWEEPEKPQTKQVIFEVTEEEQKEIIKMLKSRRLK